MKTLFAKQARLADGWARDVEIRIDAAGTISGIRTGAQAQEGVEAVACLIPGLSNVHSHAFQRALAGRMERAGPGADSFWTWRERMYACVDRINISELQAVATYLYVEMLKAGYTSVGEFHYLHHAGADEAPTDPSANSIAMIDAAAAAGMRLTLLPTLYMYGGFGGQPAEPRQRRFVTAVDDYLDLLDTLRSSESAHLRVGIAFHSLRAVSPDAMARVLEHRARTDPDGPVHVHAAEQLREVEDCIAWCGRRPLEWLLDQGYVDQRWCVVHATHMSAGETRALAASGAAAGLCPTTEANLGDGLFPLAAYLDAGGRIAIGSDSHVSVNPWEELRWLEYGQRLTMQKRNVAASAAQPHTGARLFTAALDGGARALGQPVGRIAEQYRADFLVVDRHDPLLAECVDDELFDGLVFATGRNPVTDVMVGGNWVVRDRRHALDGSVADAFVSARQRLVAAERRGIAAGSRSHGSAGKTAGAASSRDQQAIDLKQNDNP